MVPIKRQLDGDDHYPGKNNIEYIVIHDTGNYTDSDEANANYFCSGTRNSSAHYFVDDDSITQIVEDSDGAFHVGDGRGKYSITNRNSLGIEMCRVNGAVTITTENNTVELIKMKMKQYNIPLERVVRHYDASKKSCPEAFMANDWARWYEFKKKLIEERNGFKMFNEEYYLQAYPDIKVAVEKGDIHSAKWHYDNYGKAEGRRGYPELPWDYCEGSYLEYNQDVKEAVAAGTFSCGAEHWLLHGWKETNRTYNL